MKKMIYSFILLYILCPVGYASEAFPGDTLLRKNSVDNDSSAAKTRICSCQLLSVQRSPFENQLVGIFAEKTLEGKPSLNYRLMSGYLRREVYYFKYVFLQSVIYERGIESSLTCAALIEELKRANRELQVYNVMDIDVLAGIARR
jgi:hypothetical protein